MFLPKVSFGTEECDTFEIFLGIPPLPIELAEAGIEVGCIRFTAAYSYGTDLYFISYSSSNKGWRLIPGLGYSQEWIGPSLGLEYEFKNKIWDFISAKWTIVNGLYPLYSLGKKDDDKVATNDAEKEKPNQTAYGLIFSIGFGF